MIKMMENSKTNNQRLCDSMNATARSALRFINLQNLFSQTPAKEQAPLKSILKRELRIMLRRIIKLYAHLLIYAKKD